MNAGLYTDFIDVGKEVKALYKCRKRRVRNFLPDWEDFSFSEGRMGMYSAPVSSLLYSHTHKNHMLTTILQLQSLFKYIHIQTL